MYETMVRRLSLVLRPDSWLSTDAAFEPAI